MNDKKKKQSSYTYKYMQLVAHSDFRALRYVRIFYSRCTARSTLTPICIRNTTFCSQQSLIMLFISLIQVASWTFCVWYLGTHVWWMHVHNIISPFMYVYALSMFVFILCVSELGAFIRFHFPSWVALPIIKWHYIPCCSTIILRVLRTVQHIVYIFINK